MSRFIVGAAVFGFAIASPAAEGSDELVYELARAYFLLSSPLVDRETKGRQIDELMKKLETTLASSAERVRTLQTRLGEWNSQLQREISEGNVSRLHGDLNAVLRRAGIGVNGALPDPTTMKAMVDSFQVFLAPLAVPDAPERYRYRVKMGVEWLRHIIRMEEENLFGIVSAQPEARAAAATKLAEDIQNIARRSRALMRLTQIFGQALDVQRAKDPLDESRSIMQIRLKQVDLSPQLPEIFEHLDTLGTFYGKMGQTLSNMDMFFGPEITTWFRSLQNQYKEPMPFSQVQRIIREDFGKELTDLYTDFEEESFARGTMAQAHRARKKGTGEKVVVKVQRPGLLEELRWNSGINTAMVKFMKVIAAEPASTEVLDMLNEQLDAMVSSFAAETFFPVEARTMEAFRHRLAILGGAKVPRAHLDLVSDRIITMEEVEGRSIDDYLAGDKSKRGAQKAFRQLLDVLTDLAIIGHGHIDLQPGNILVTDDGRLVLLDWGNTARIRGIIANPLKLLWAMRARDPKKIAEAMAGMQKTGGTVTAEQLRPLVETHLGLMSLGKSRPWEGILGPTKRRPGQRPLRSSDPAPLAAPGKPEELPPFLKLVIESSMKLGFRLDPSYARVLRGAIPLLGTLDRFEMRLGTDEMRRIIQRHPFNYGMKAPIKLANLVLRSMTHPIPPPPHVPCRFGLLDLESITSVKLD